jgi:hypothetical protein
MDKACSTHGLYCKYTYKILVGNHEGKRPLGRPRSRWEDNVTMERMEIGLWGGGVCTGFIWLRIGNGGGFL